VRLRLHPSRVLAAAIIAAHAAAAGAVVFLMKDGFGAALGLALLALGVAAAWRRALLRGPDAVRAIEVHAEVHGNELSVELGDGRVVRVPVARRRYVSRALVTLALGAPARRWYGARTLLVTADMLEAGEFRRLRVWALWGRLPGVAAEQLAA
jgi:hypothetical protein